MFLGLTDVDIHGNFEPIFLSNVAALICIIFNETVVFKYLVRTSIATGRIGSGFLLIETTRSGVYTVFFNITHSIRYCDDRSETDRMRYL